MADVKIRCTHCGHQGVFEPPCDCPNCGTPLQNVVGVDSTIRDLVAFADQLGKQVSVSVTSVKPLMADKIEPERCANDYIIQLHTRSYGEPGDEPFFMGRLWCDEDGHVHSISKQRQALERVVSEVGEGPTEEPVN